MTEVPIAVGMPYEITANLNISDGLVNGACCHVRKIDHKQANNDRPSIIWVEFEDDSTGKETRTTYKHLRSPDVHNSWTPIFDTQRNFLYNRKSFIRIQFPLRPAAAKTIHKSQGCTLRKVVVDMTTSRKQPHMHYVALSRVRNLSDLYLLNLNEDKMSVDSAVNAEMIRMHSEAKLKLCYLPPYDLSPHKLKVAFLNVRSLLLHHKDIKNDFNIIGADVLAFAETKLKLSISDDTLKLHGFRIQRNDQQSTHNPHHGLAMYFGNNIGMSNVQSISSFDFECMVTRVQKHETTLQIAVIYKSPKCSYSKLKIEMLTHIKSQIDLDEHFLILGDFNVDIISNNTFLEWMETNFKCKQIVSSVTTDHGSTLDLIFTNIPNPISSVVECCWSDHKLVYAAV